MMRERRVRPWMILVALVVVAGLLWVLVPSPFLRGLLVGALLGPAAVVGGLSLVAGRMRKKLGGRLEPPPLPVARWDLDMRAEDLEGHVRHFSEFSGRVLILNFWATWCAPCVAEMPSLARLQELTSDLGVALACVSKETREKVRECVAKRDLRVPVFIVEDGVPECFRVRAIPATFVLDKKGTIVLRHLGAAAWDHVDVVAFVRGLALASGRLISSAGGA
ncbi:MAG: TlpA disulfide reductase family protein [Gemmatimonadota bacterium]